MVSCARMRDRCRLVALLLMALLGPAVGSGCRGREPSLPKSDLDGAVCSFDIFWPPRDPLEQTPGADVRPLLTGTLTVDIAHVKGANAEARLAITIVRPSEEADRQYWNSQLAFADISWMNEVRVWDTEDKWLWPNLPYLLRQPGLERVERYGGIDPGKQVDNDFAAVLIRKYDADGNVESPDTKASPLVSAEWQAVPPGPTDLQTVVHTACSKTFVVRLGDGSRLDRGRIKVWLIYADFLGSWPPRSWPQEREWAGGILAYFEIDWETDLAQDGCGTVRAIRPREGTGFDWAAWIAGTPGSQTPAAQTRLSDHVD